MNNNKIIIDLNQFEGKSVIQMKTEILEKLGKIWITYDAPTPYNSKKAISFKLMEKLDFSSKFNDERINKVELKDL